MTKEKIFVWLAAAFLLGMTAGMLLQRQLPPAPIIPDEEGIACTMEAMLCPDGSFVGRVGPNCEFALCPGLQPIPEPTPLPIPVPNPLPEPVSGSCVSNNDCPAGYSCIDVSPVVREGVQNLRCWKDGMPTPICLSEDTAIATPFGERPVTELQKGDIVWSVNKKGERIAAALVAISKTRVPAGHQVVHIVLSDGRELFASPRHQLGDGREMGMLSAGAYIENAEILTAERVRYSAAYTYDILPAGETGMYWGGGTLLQSTLR